MKILVTGATGFIGRALSLELVLAGHQLWPVTRRSQGLPANWGLPSTAIIWDPTRGPCPVDIDDIDAVVHLMGEGVADQRWTPARRQAILDSRVKASTNLLDAINKRQKPLPCLISASAIGYYPFDEAESLDESAAPGQHFLAEVCQAWEAALKGANTERSVVLRFGLVIGADGGVLKKLRPLFALGLGGRLGHGQQMMSWIHRDDIIGIIKAALQHKHWQGAINCVSPQVISNREFTLELATSVGKRAWFTVPAAALKLAFGEMSQVLLAGQNIQPKRLQELGYTFLYPRLREALTEACTRHPHRGGFKSCERLETVQFVARPQAEVFKFFCDPHNLERLTPKSLRFKILSIRGEPIGEGTTIAYKLRVHGLPLRWLTEIKEWQAPRCFADNQEKGPYTIWYHRHLFEAVAGGTLLIDRVAYRVPAGALGRIFVLPLVQRDVRGIFHYRRQVIRELFS